MIATRLCPKLTRKMLARKARNLVAMHAVTRQALQTRLKMNNQKINLKQRRVVLPLKLPLKSKKRLRKLKKLLLEKNQKSSLLVKLAKMLVPVKLRKKRGETRKV